MCEIGKIEKKQHAGGQGVVDGRDNTPPPTNREDPKLTLAVAAAALLRDALVIPALRDDDNVQWGRGSDHNETSHQI
jgi:hypothetical protein